MDQSKRSALIEFAKVERGFPEDSVCPVVPLDRFFEGNDDLGSIGCNLQRHPGVDQFSELFSSLLLRDDVTDIQVELSEIVEEDDTMWPFSERVYVAGKIDLAALQELLATLEPDEVSVDDEPPSELAMKEFDLAYSVWWD
ncbi:MAG: hypothetical protein AAF958_08350 [Planctomycetota bacterium]